MDATGSPVSYHRPSNEIYPVILPIRTVVAAAKAINIALEF
jgi:hypothetical protein